MNPTFLAHVQIQQADQTWIQEWLETSDYANAASLTAALEEQAYSVISIVDMEDIKTW